MKAAFLPGGSWDLFARSCVKTPILLSLLLVSFITPFHSFSQTTPLSFTTIPYADPDIISPGRGAEQWHDGNGSIAYPLSDQSIPSMDAYYRFTWNRLEGAARGSYDWEYFDGLIKEVINKGQKLSFGIMTCYPDGGSNHGMVNYDNGNAAYPEYLHRLMQGEGEPDWKTTGTGPTDGYGSWVPNWNSPYYLDRLKALHEALYAHIKSSSYTATAGPNKGKTIAYRDAIFSIDIRGYGSWGEWHSAGIINVMTSYPSGRRPTAATLKTIIDHHVNVFTDHPLSIMISAFDAERLPNTDNPKEVAAYALAKTNNWGKLGWRRDNWGAIDNYIDGYLKGNTLSFGTSGPFNAIITERWKYAPVTGEPPSWVASLSGCGYDDFERQVREYHATSVGNGNYGSTNLDDCAQENIRNAFKAAGYRFIIESGNISSTIKRDSAFKVTLNWKNIGIAPTYEKWNVVFDLKDAGNNIVWSGTSQFSPGPKANGLALLPSSAATPATDNFVLPASVQPGNYKLTLTIKDPGGYRTPLPLAITGGNTDGSYTVKDVVVGTRTTAPTVPPTTPSPVTKATLIGTVGLQGRPAAPHVRWQIPLEVNLYTDSSASTLANAHTINTDSSGRFIIDSITPGTYYITVKNSHTLQRSSSDSLIAGDNNIFFGILLEGDVNNDNIISSVDSILLMNSLNAAAGDSLFDVRADLNEDSIVNTLDSLLLMANYNNQRDSTGNCAAISATISNTSACDAQPFNLVLSSATGIAPFDVVINGKTYNDIFVGGVITTITAAEKIWSANPVAKTYEDSPVELGVRFASATPGFVKGVRFFSANNVSGTYTGHLWTADGSLLASAVFTNVTADGWQEVLFSEPVKIEAGVIYVASYYNSSGFYAATSQGLSEAVNNGNSLTILTNDGKGTGGVYTYNGPGFPTETYNATNYWVDVMFASGPFEFKLSGVTDSMGCTATGDLQTLTVTTSPCTQQRQSLATQSTPVQKPVLVETKNQAELSFSNELRQNYPNPFNNETTISFSLAKASKVNLSVFDMNGRLVKVLVSTGKEAGTHTIRLNSGSLGKGLYIYKIQAGEYSAAKRMVIQ